MKNLPVMLGCLVLLNACSSTVALNSALNSEPPMLSISSMTPLLKCAADNVVQAHKEQQACDCDEEKKPKSISRLLVVIDNDQFADGTVRKNSASDGPLADSNQAQMKAILNRWIPSYILTIPAREIPLLRRNGVKGSSVTNFGTLDADTYKALQSQYSVDNIVYFSGAFTKLDNDTPVLDQGFGSHIKNDGTIGAAFSKGRAERETVLGLSTSLGHVGTNTLLSSTMIEARMHRSSNEIKFSLAPGEANLALSKKIIVSEGVQGTQQMLLEAAALWFIGLAYPQQAKLSQCLAEPGHPNRMLGELEQWQGLSETQQIARVQSLLKQQGQLKAEYQQGVMDGNTLLAIRKYATANSLFYTPHTAKSLDSLYLHLSRLNPVER